jgi:hypothetical protein
MTRDCRLCARKIKRCGEICSGSIWKNRACAAKDPLSDLVINLLVGWRALWPNLFGIQNSGLWERPPFCPPDLHLPTSDLIFSPHIPPWPIRQDPVQSLRILSPKMFCSGPGTASDLESPGLRKSNLVLWNLREQNLVPDISRSSQRLCAPSGSPYDL